MKAHVVIKAGLWLGICLWVQASCNGGGSDGDDDDGVSGSGTSASAGSGTGGSSTGGSGAGFPSTGGAAGSSTAGSGTAGSTTAGSAGSSTAGSAGSSGECVPGTTQCSNCIDDDGDGQIDGFDTECTGFIDNDESSYATAIPGDNVDACKQDCFFDGNSGSGDDKCLWDLACDPANPGKDLGCPYNPDQQNCPPPPSEACLNACMGLVPNGCDCFGCCVVTLPAGGTRTVVLTPTCTYENINDPVACPVCTQVTACTNPCERCELCIGKDEVPADCNPGTGGSGGAGGGGTGGSGTGGSGTGGTGGGGVPTCAPNVEPCTPSDPCTGLAYCLTGCCVPLPG